MYKYNRAVRQWCSHVRYMSTWSEGNGKKYKRWWKRKQMKQRAPKEPSPRAHVFVWPPGRSVQGHGGWYIPSHSDSLHARVLAYPAPTGPAQQRQGNSARTLLDYWTDHANFWCYYYQLSLWFPIVWIPHTLHWVYCDTLLRYHDTHKSQCLPALMCTCVVCVSSLRWVCVHDVCMCNVWLVCVLCVCLCLCVCVVPPCGLYRIGAINLKCGQWQRNRATTREISCHLLALQFAHFSAYTVTSWIIITCHAILHACVLDWAGQASN